MKKNINEFLFSMMPEADTRLSFQDSILLYDNLSEDIEQSPDYESFNPASKLPAKIKFSLSLMCSKGVIKINLNLEEYILHAGDAITCTSDTICSNIEFSPDCRLIAVCISNHSNIEKAVPDLSPYFLQKGLIKPNKITIRPDFFEDCIQLYHQLRKWISCDDFSRKVEAVEGTIRTMTSIVVDSMKKDGDTSKQSRKDMIFRDFIKEVGMHYREHRDLTFYADKLCITPKYMGRVVKACSGRRPTDFIRDYIILDAKAMLRSHKYTVSQIANYLHFENTSFFGKYFKEAVGCSPLKY